MSQELATRNPAAILEKVVTKGDLADLSPNDRANYYRSICESLKLNWQTKPFEFLEMKDKQSGAKKIILYARKDCAEQLRRRDKVSIQILSREVTEDVYVVTTRATLPDGRTDEAIGAVGIRGLSAEDRANAYKKAETQAKRRVTLSICGLGFLDETEALDLPGAKVLETNLESEVR